MKLSSVELPKNCILLADTAANKNPAFKINDTKLSVPSVTLSTQENIKCMVLKEKLIGINI